MGLNTGMKPFSQHLREAVISRKPSAKRAGKLTRDPQTVERLRKEFTHNGVTWINYTDIGHDNPMPWLLQKWGLSATETSRDLLPLLWWVDRKGQVVIWEIPPDQHAGDVIHDEIPEYKRESQSRFRGMTQYQGRIDRIRKSITIISGATDSIIAQRALQRGKGRVASTLSRMFKGYTIIDRDTEGAIEL